MNKPDDQLQERQRDSNPDHPEHDDSPKFGRLLLVLFAAVALIVVITFASEAFYTP